jgi:hypothetical protein
VIRSKGVGPGSGTRSRIAPGSLARGASGVSPSSPEQAALGDVPNASFGVMLDANGDALGHVVVFLRGSIAAYGAGRDQSRRAASARSRIAITTAMIAAGA